MAGDDRQYGPSPAWQPGTGAPGAPTPPPQMAVPPPPPPQQPQRRRGTNWWVVALVAFLLLSFLGGLLLVGVAFVGLAAGGGEGGWSGFGDKVAVITISGIITEEGEETMFGDVMPGARSYMRYIRDAADDDSIQAVLVRINSPGGGAAASQEVYGEIIKLKEKKPVVVSMGEVAASGGYYIASAADKIYANPATLTGSIGVIMETVQYQDMLAKIGVEMEALTTGPYKDTGSPIRPMRDDERKMLKGMLDNIYQQFVRDVAAGRKMKEADVRKIADGRVLTGEQALKAGLVDELGNYHDAIAAAGELGGIEGEPNLKVYGESGGLRQLLGALAQAGRHRIIHDLLTDYRLLGAEKMLQMPGAGVE